MVILVHCDAIIRAICHNLSSAENLENVVVCREFPNVKQDIPLTKTIISVGLEGIDITRGVDSLTISADASPIYYKIGITLCVPKRQTGETCHETGDKVISALKTVVLNYSTTDVKVGQTKYSNTLGALTVPITIRIYNGNVYKG